MTKEAHGRDRLCWALKTGKEFFKNRDWGEGRKEKGVFGDPDGMERAQGKFKTHAQHREWTSHWSSELSRAEFSPWALRPSLSLEVP